MSKREETKEDFIRFCLKTIKVIFILIISYVVGVTVAFFISLKFNLSIRVYNLICYIILLVLGYFILRFKLDKKEQSKVRTSHRKRKSKVKEEDYEWTEE